MFLFLGNNQPPILKYVLESDYIFGEIQYYLCINILIMSLYFVFIECILIFDETVFYQNLAVYSKFIIYIDLYFSILSIIITCRIIYSVSILWLQHKNLISVVKVVLAMTQLYSYTQKTANEVTAFKQLGWMRLDFERK